MTSRIAMLLCASLLLCSACSDDTVAHEDATGVAGQSVGSSLSWTITPQGVGPLRLGGGLIEPEQGFESAYWTSFYGAAQPLEGFVLTNPPVLAIFKGGPFSVWGSKHVGRSPPPALQTRAIALAGADRFKVDMLVITDERPKTAEGISVGDSYAEFARAYPRAPAPDAFTELWESPSCMVNRDTIWFFFDRCDDADNAKLIRIAVRTNGSRT